MRLYYIASKEIVTTKVAISDNMQKVLLDNRNIEVITYDNQSDCHVELLDALKDLVGKVEAKRNEMSDTLTW